MTDPVDIQEFGRISLFKEGMKSEIDRIMPALKHVEVLPGRFNLDWLQDKSFRAPAAFPTVLKSPFEIRSDRRLWLKANCACFFVAEGREEQRDKSVWAMAEAFASILPNNTFKLGKISAPENIEVDPLISAQISRKKIAIVAVTWRQTLRAIGEGLFDDEGTLLKELYLGSAEDPHYEFEEEDAA